MASIIKRNGKYTVYVRKGKYKYKPVTATFTKKTLAQKWAINTENSIERGEFIDGRNAKGVLITELIDKYETEISKQKGPSTYDREKSRLQKLRGMFHNMTVYNCTLEKVLGEARTMLGEHTKHGKPYSKSTVRKHLQDLMNVFNACENLWEFQLPHGNVARLARERLTAMNLMVKYDLERDTRLEDMDYDRIKSFKHARPQTLFKWVALFAIETGMRRGEILHMKWGQVLYGERIYALEEQKSDHTRRRFKTGRDIPLTSTAMAILRMVNYLANKYPKSARKGFVWPWVDGKSLYDGVKRIYIKLGIENTTFHDLRHEFGGHAVESNMDVRLVGAALGHASLKSTHRYTKSRGSKVAKLWDEKTKR
jgi:integrase